MSTSTDNKEEFDKEEEFEAQVEEKMKKMVAVRDKMFNNALSNIRGAQTRYKKDYDKKRSQTEVNCHCTFLVVHRENEFTCLLFIC